MNRIATATRSTPQKMVGIVLQYDNGVNKIQITSFGSNEFYMK